MANLRCFYCNKKSLTRFTGQKQWDCKQCLATNFLDANGDITDPPVATFKIAPAKRITSSESPPNSRPASRTSNSASTFCATCIQNQDLYVKSLAQYDFDTDTDRPGYKQDERKYFEYRKGLEQRYPQVCEECEPKALNLMRDANKVAKYDYIRKSLDKSRAQKSRSQIGGWTVYGSVVSIGKSLWYGGLISQLIWHFMALASIAQHSLSLVSDGSYSSMISIDESPLLKYAISLPVLKQWAYYGLIASFLSIWWNPKFRDIERGVPKHITGFSNWYTQAVVLFAIRVFIFYVTGTTAMADPNASVTMACHGFAIVFITSLASVIHHTLKIDRSPLWETTPEKFKVVGPKAPKPLFNPSMNEILNEISSAAGKTRASPPTEFGFKRSPSTSPIQTLLQSERAARARYAECEAMDWSPAPLQLAHPISSHRAFAPDQPPQRSTQLFGQAPIQAEKGAFWYKVPPAPMTPAHRLRNPPNQPRIQPASAEEKEKFFAPLGPRLPTLKAKPEKPAEFYMAQQKFFPVATRGVDEDGLADMMGGFTLKEDTHPPKPKYSYGSILQFGAMCGTAGLAWFWYRGDLTTLI